MSLETKNEALTRKVGELERALKDISNPMFMFNAQAAARGDRVDIGVAMRLSNDPEFLRELARKATNTPKE